MSIRRQPDDAGAGRSARPDAKRVRAAKPAQAAPRGRSKVVVFAEGATWLRRLSGGGALEPERHLGFDRLGVARPHHRRFERGGLPDRSAILLSVEVERGLGWVRRLFTRRLRVERTGEIGDEREAVRFPEQANQARRMPGQLDHIEAGDPDRQHVAPFYFDRAPLGMKT